MFTNSQMKALNKEQLLSACEKSLSNAKDLIDDAELLFENKRFSRTLFLSLIASEEIGKHMIFVSTYINFVTEQEINWKRFWKEITTHHEKLNLVNLVEELRFDTVSLDTVAASYIKTISHSKSMDKTKQKSLYMDFTKGYPHVPSEFISEKLAEENLVLSKNRFMYADALYNFLQETKYLDSLTKSNFEERLEIAGLEDFIPLIKKKF